MVVDIGNDDEFVGLRFLHKRVDAGSNGFTYELLNSANMDGTGGLQLQVLTNGAPTPAVPEASTTVSMGLLLLLGGGGLVIAKRRRTVAAA